MTLNRLKPGSRMSEAVTLGQTVYLTGQIPNSLTADITVQTHEVLAEIDVILAQLGCSKSDLVSGQVWLSDMADFAEMNLVWDARVDILNPPVPATGGVASARPGMGVEMIAITHLPVPSF